MLDVLENPQTQEYVALKQHILSADFPLHWVHATICENQKCQADAIGVRCPDSDGDIPYLSHGILRRSVLEMPKREAQDIEGLWNRLADGGAPEIASPIFDATLQVFNQILDHNGVGPRHFYRMNVNMTMPTPKRLSPSHTDHPYPHRNLLIYLNEFTGGHTWVGGVQGPQPTEDMVISFNGVSHRAAPPLDDRRMVLLATYGTEDEVTS